jgi:hypothetical protein
LKDISYVELAAMGKADRTAVGVVCWSLMVTVTEPPVTFVRTISVRCTVTSHRCPVVPGINCGTISLSQAV